MKYSIELGTKGLSASIQFLYINFIHDIHEWGTEPFSFRYCKLNIFISGQVYVSVNSNIYSPQYGDIIFYKPFDIHYGRIPQKQRLEYFELQILPDAFDFIEGGRSLLNLFMTNEEPVPYCYSPKDTYKEELIRLFFNTLACLESGAADSKARALAMIIQILSRVNACIDKMEQLKSIGSLPALLVAALAYIDENFAEIHSLKEICDKVSVSISYLTRQFNQYLGCTPYQYLIKRKIMKAKIMLHEDHTVTEVCYECGFNDCSNFINTFKAMTGITPHKYRKMYLKSLG